MHEPVVAATEPAPAARERHPVRKRKRSYLVAKLAAVWVLVLVGIVFAARHFWHDDAAARETAELATAETAKISPEDVAFLNEAAPLANQTFSNFLASGTPEQRNQFVLSPITTASRMARFYSLNPVISLDPATLALTGSAVLELPGGPAIETQWTSADGHVLDAVFLQQNNEWRLDWAHVARFSDYPGPLFLAGSELAAGEFRLLARERLAEERKDAETISIVLYAPRFGFSGETGFVSPEFLVPRASEDGRMLEAAFALAKADKRPFGMTLPRLDPDGLIRVRAKVRRIDENMERRFEIEDIVACHWYSTEESGIDVAD